VYSLFVKALLLENHKVWDIAMICNLCIEPVMEEIIATYLISSEKKRINWFGRMKIMGVIRLNLATV
jgi:hypothetical protein